MEADAAFYERVLRRMYRWMALAAAAGTMAALWWQGWRGAVAFLLGAAVAYWSFKWLHEAVESLAPGAPPPRKRVFVFLALRYAGFGLGGYVIVNLFGMNAIAAMCGLFVPVAAVLIEIIYELADGT
jgi:hypothetical protein